MLIWLNKIVGFQPSFSRQGHSSRNACLCSFGLTKTTSPRAFVASVVSAFWVDSLRDGATLYKYWNRVDSIPDCRWQARILPSLVHDAHRIQFRGRVNGTARLLNQLHHDTTAHSICQVTKIILDAEYHSSRCDLKLYLGWDMKWLSWAKYNFSARLLWTTTPLYRLLLLINK